MEFPVTINSQDEFDGLVKDRITRAERKATEPFADYADLKAKADGFDSIRTELEQKLAEATSRADAAEGKVTEFETAKQINDWRTEVAQATGVPANALRGSTKEEFEAHAAELKPLITGTGPVIPTQGDQPTATASKSPWSEVLDEIGSQRDNT